MNVESLSPMDVDVSRPSGHELVSSLVSAQKVSSLVSDHFISETFHVGAPCITSLVYCAHFFRKAVLSLGSHLSTV